MKKTTVFLVFGSILLSVCLSYSAMNLKQASSELVMSDVESISQNEINPCGNVTYFQKKPYGRHSAGMGLPIKNARRRKMFAVIHLTRLIVHHYLKSEMSYEKHIRTIVDSFDV